MGKLEDKAKKAVLKAEERAARPRQELSEGISGPGRGIGWKPGGGERESGGSGKEKKEVKPPEPVKRVVVRKKPEKSFVADEIKVKSSKREYIVTTPGFQTRGKKRTFVEGIDIYHDE